MRLIEFDRPAPLASIWVNPEHVVSVNEQQVEVRPVTFGTRIQMVDGSEVITPRPVEEVVVRLRDEGA